MNHILRIGELYDSYEGPADLHEEVMKCRRAAENMGVEWEDVMSHNRHQYLCDFRFLAMKHLRDKGFTYKVIGGVFNKRDHSTAVYAVQTAENLIATDRVVRQKWTTFRQS